MRTEMFFLKGSHSFIALPYFSMLYPEVIRKSSVLFNVE